MVLLTSSTVSVMVSSGIVCMFTFLLFLCGYTLQQQTVRSLQDAIRRPPEPKPVPTLPPQFRDQENDTVSVVFEQAGDDVEGNPGQTIESIHVDVVDVSGQTHLNEGSQKPESRKKPSEEAPLQLERLAYMFALVEPADLCSALLFAKQQRSSSRLAAEPSIILLYPSTWESVSSRLHTSVLSFMREMQEIHNLIYHPVQIYNTWDINSQLLGELQWNRWDYDQALYLRSPGLILDVKALDTVLETPTSGQSWQPLHPSSGNNPDVLLLTQKGLRSPKREMRSLAMSAESILPEARGGGLAAKQLIQETAYFVFEDRDLAEESEDNVWYGNLVQEFVKGRKAVCAGSGLLERNLKSDLKRRRGVRNS